MLVSIEVTNSRSGDVQTSFPIYSRQNGKRNCKKKIKNKGKKDCFQSDVVIVTVQFSYFQFFVLKILICPEQLIFSGRD